MAKRITSRQKEKLHGKKKNLTAKRKKTHSEKNNHDLMANEIRIKMSPQHRGNFAASLFLFAVSLFLFAMRLMLLL